MSWNVDRRKMYAHVYFDLAQDNLGLAVYAIGKIPGFSGKLLGDLASQAETSKAYDLFLKTLGKESISKQELQQGKIFNFSDMKDKLKALDYLGKAHAQDASAQVLVNLDDPMFWFNFKLGELPTSEQKKLLIISDEEKKKLGEQVKESQLDDLFSSINTEEELDSAFRKIYTTVSRSINPKSGPKDFPKSKKYPTNSPPTFLYSEDYDVAFYPGFRGAQYMTKVPSSLEYVHPQEAEQSEKWQTILVPDTKEYLSLPLNKVDVEFLDYTSEVLAKMFYHNLEQAGEKSLTIMDFNKASSPVSSKAKDLLTKIGQQIISSDTTKTASSLIGKWIDLYTGKIYSSEQELLQDKLKYESSEYKRPLAAKTKERMLKRASKLQRVLQILRQRIGN